MTARIQSPGELRQRAGPRDQRSVGARIAQPHIVPFTGLRQGRDRLRVPAPAGRKMCGLHLHRRLGIVQRVGPFHTGLIRHVAIEQGVGAHEAGLRGECGLRRLVVQRRLGIERVAAL